MPGKAVCPALVFGDSAILDMADKSQAKSKQFVGEHFKEYFNCNLLCIF